MIQLTDSAGKQVLEAAKQANAEGMPLRVAAKYAADGSIEYAMGFDEPKDSDLRTEQQGVSILVDPESAELLEDCVLDFAALDEGESQFIFMNPADPHYVPPKKKEGAPDYTPKG